MMCSHNFLHDSEIEKLFNQSCRLYLITEKKHTFNYRLMRKQTLVIAATTPCIIPSQFLVWKCIFVLIRAMAGLYIFCNRILQTSWNKLFKIYSAATMNQIVISRIYTMKYFEYMSITTIRNSYYNCLITIYQIIIIHVLH